jgi:hypothetical protein
LNFVVSEIDTLKICQENLKKSKTRPKLHVLQIPRKVGKMLVRFHCVSITCISIITFIDAFLNKILKIKDLDSPLNKRGRGLG